MTKRYWKVTGVSKGGESCSCVVFAESEEEAKREAMYFPELQTITTVKEAFGGNHVEIDPGLKRKDVVK